MEKSKFKKAFWPGPERKPAQKEEKKTPKGNYNKEPEFWTRKEK